MCMRNYTTLIINVCKNHNEHEVLIFEIIYCLSVILVGTFLD